MSETLLLVRLSQWKRTTLVPTVVQVPIEPALLERHCHPREAGALAVLAPDPPPVATLSRAPIVASATRGDSSSYSTGR